MNEELNEDARTKQDLLYECSSLECKLSNELIKNEHLEQQVKKQKEVINKAIEYIKSNIYEEDNGCGDYWWEIADKDELLKILQDKEVSE